MRRCTGLRPRHTAVCRSTPEHLEVLCPAFFFPDGGLAALPELYCTSKSIRCILFRLCYCPCSFDPAGQITSEFCPAPETLYHRFRCTAKSLQPKPYYVIYHLSFRISIIRYYFRSYLLIPQCPRKISFHYQLQY